MEIAYIIPITNALALHLVILSASIEQRNPRGPDDLTNSTHAAKFNESKVTSSSTHPINGQHPVGSDISSAAAFREKGYQPELTNKAASVPMALKPGTFPFGATNTASVPLSSAPGSEIDKTAFQSQHQFWPGRSFTDDSNVTEKLKDQELTIESGTISISSIYSQGLVYFLRFPLALYENNDFVSQISNWENEWKILLLCFNYTDLFWTYQY